MKKTSIVLLLVLALALIGVMVSCKNEISAPADELVSVSFEEADASRSLTATLEAFDKDNYYWKYAADKADDSGLTSGETATYDEAGALPVSNGNKGLRSVSDDKPYKVPGFSQGLWNFKLYAYRNKNAETGAYEDLVYQGEAKNVSLTKGGDNTALVTVSPATEGNGYIKIGTITFVPKKSGDQAAQLKFISVTNPDGSAVAGISYDTTTQTYTVPAGAYKVTVRFANASQTIVYGEGYVIATVYPNLTTTIAGELSEMVTYAQFDADLNPDAVNVQAESAEIQYGTGANVEIKTAATAEKQVKTSVARADANAIITAMAEEQGVDTGSSTTLKLTLNVDPTEATETTVTYEIGMKATLTYTKDTQTQTSEKAVTSLTNYVIVEIEMSKGLSSVTVKHSDVAMVKCDSLAELEASTSDVPTHPGFYFYDAAGTLYIKTRTFSPFAISYIAPANYAAKLDGVKYVTLADAIAALPTDNEDPKTITLLCDVTNAEGVSVGSGKNFIVDFAGHTYTVNKPGAGSAGTETAAFQLLKDSTIVFKNGTINVSEDNLSPAPQGKKNILDIAMVYANFTLENMTIDGRNLYPKYGGDWIMSFCNGNSRIIGETSFIGNLDADEMVFDVDAPADYASCSLEIDTTGTIPGQIEIVRTGKPVSLSIKNGTFTGTLNVGKTDNISVSISGGKFADKNVRDYLALGYTAKENEYGYWQVEEVSFTLVEAIDSTCSEKGHHTYWLGSDGKKYIKDGDNLWLATDTDLVIDKHHYWVYESRSDSPDTNGKYTVTYRCQNCGETNVVTGWNLVKIEDNKSETPLNIYSYLAPLTATDLSGEKTIFELGEGLYTVKASGFNSPKEMYLRTECIIVGKGSAKTTIQITNDSNWKKGIQLYNRYMTESGIPQSNFQFAGLTIEDTSAVAKDDWHLLLITSYGVELGLNDVTFKSFKGTTNVGFWANQTLSDGKYPTKADAQGIYISLKDVEFVDTVKPFIQNQSFTAANIAGQSDCYSSVHLLVESVGDLTLASQGGNNIHDGIHTEWFVNGAIARVPGTTGIYAPTEVAELQ